MSVTFLKALVVLVPASMLLCGSVVLFWRARAVASLLQVVGAGSMVIVALTHVCEALNFFSWMKWGMQHSVGHYLDLYSAILALTLFPAGYLLQALTKRRA